MEHAHVFFKSILPKYLRALPLPKTFAGLLKLSGEQWMELVPFVLLVGFILYATVKFFINRRKPRLHPKVNPSIQKEESKVVNQMDIEDIGDKIAFCRCWRSKTFPLCDGSHNAHNKAARDNVGPLLLMRNHDEK